MKKILVLFLVLISTVCFSAPQTSIFFRDTGGDPHIVGEDDPLPVDASFNADGTNIAPVTYWATQTLTLVANTAQDITTALTSTNRRFIELKSHDPNDVFWIDFGATAVVNASRPCEGYFYGEVPIGITVSVIASTAYDIAVTEGGDD